MKVLKIIGGVLGGLVGLIAVASAVFWFGWLSIPDADDTCGHLTELLESEGGPGELPPVVQEACVEYVNTPNMFKGRIRHVEDIKCMNDASDLDTVAGECDGDTLVTVLRNAQLAERALEVREAQTAR